MKNQSDDRPGNLKKAAVGGGALAAAGGLAALALRRKSKLRIGTPLSKAKVVASGGTTARQAAGKVMDMSERIDAQLRQFASLDIAQEPYNYDYCAPPVSPRKPNFPTLFIDRSKDAGLMKMPGTGTATITYKVKRRNVDEDREDGVPLYGANIEIQSMEPVGTVKGLESTLFLHHFAEGRDRDGAGRFAAGHVPSPTDYAIAGAVPKKKAALGVGAGVAAAGGAAALLGTKRGRSTVARIATAGKNLLG